MMESGYVPQLLKCDFQMRCDFSKMFSSFILFDLLKHGVLLNVFWQTWKMFLIYSSRYIFLPCVILISILYQVKIFYKNLSTSCICVYFCLLYVTCFHDKTLYKCRTYEDKYFSLYNARIRVVRCWRAFSFNYGNMHDFYPITYKCSHIYKVFNYRM